MKARCESTRASPVDGVDAAISARAAEERSRVSGQELTEEEEKLHEGPVSAATGRARGAWKKFKVFKPAAAFKVFKRRVPYPSPLWILSGRSPGKWWKAKGLRRLLRWRKGTRVRT